MGGMSEQLDAKHLVDHIVYLASLVSEPCRIDTILDKLRILTANAQDLSSEHVKTLRAIEAELKEHLIKEEKLRSFTAASLEANMDKYFAEANPVQAARKTVLGRLIGSVVAASVLTGVLAVSGVMKGQVVLAFLIAALFVGLAFLFQSIKKDLVEQLHGSVNYLMAATIGTGLFALNFPIIAANSYLESHPMFQHGGFLIGAVPVYVCYYLAFYLYAKQVGAKMPWVLKPSGAAMNALLVAIVAILLPHPVPVSHEAFFDLAVVGFSVSVYFSAIAAILGFIAIPKTTRRYSRSISFLVISMILQTIGNGYLLVFITFMSGDFPVNEEKGQILTGVFIIAALVMQYISAYKSKMAFAVN